ncbi:MAG: tetratricopeptide repeat protein, partial [Friedmanniella sp.]
MPAVDPQLRGFGGLTSRLVGGLPVAENLDGVVLFADLAGFTALAESLARSGTSGGEMLHGLLNGYFAILIENVRAAGGEVTTFAGDALAALFAGGAERRDQTALRALSCAVSMQDSLTTFAAAQEGTGTRSSPHMRIGLGGGGVTRALVGEESHQVLHVLAGPALECAVAAQRECRPGEVIADGGLVAPAAHVQVAARRGPWCVLRSGWTSEGTTNPLPADPAAGWGAADGSDGPAARAEAQQLGDEHRLVTSVFLSLPPMDVPGDGGVTLQRYLRGAMPVIRRHGGDLRQVDAGDKGYQLVAGFGAPRTAADDAERAVACCLELARGPMVPVRAGVATGLAFCAELGTVSRREYVVIGDSVNVAARLAGAAIPGQVLVDAATSARCRAFADQRALGPLALKGRTEPVEAFAVEGLREVVSLSPTLAATGAAAFVGRADELAVARAQQERAHRGRGRVLLVTGDPGLGKSRLVAELTSAPASRKVVVAVGAGGMPGDVRPYLAWRPIWRSLLFGPGRPVPGLSELPAVLAGDARRDDRSPLLGPVLGIEMSDNAFTAALSPAQRADATRALLLDCLRRCCASSPLTLVVDDAQWLDELSQQLLTQLAAAIAELPVLLVVVARDEPRTAPLLARLRSGGACTSLPLAGLPPGKAEDLVRARVDGPGQQLPAELVSHLVQRSGGNPLFLEQLVSWAGEHPESLSPEHLPEFPGDVRRLVLARVDRLLPQGQNTLKAASVIADDFSAASVHACLSARGSRREVERDLRELVRLDLIGTRSQGPEVTYTFRHTLVQEVVYGSLSSAARSQLHESVAEHLEQTHAGSLQGWVDQLAHHYGRSRNVPKQRVWFRAAGDAAAQAYANDAAVGYYRRLVALLSEAEKPQVLVRIGAIHQMTGRWRDGEEVLRSALRGAVAAGDQHTEAQAERELGLVLLPTRRFTEAVDLLRSAADAFAVQGDRPGQARALDRLAYALIEHGDYHAAFRVAEEQLAVEQPRQDPAGLGAALENLGLVHWRWGEHREAMRLLRRAYALARRSGDRRLVVHSANDLAGLCAERGDHGSAVRYLREAITTAQHIGYREATAYLTGNAGELYRDRGDLDEAQRHFAASLRAAVDVGDWLTIVFCVSALATTAAEQGAPGHRELLRRAAEIAGQLHQSREHAELL